MEYENTRSEVQPDGCNSVLILVLMEYENTHLGRGQFSVGLVLILVLMEYENTVCKSIS